MVSRDTRHFIAGATSTKADVTADRPSGPRINRGDIHMFETFPLSRTIWPGLALAGALMLSAQPVFAGQCPADKMKANARQMVDDKPVGVTDVTLGAIDLEKQPAHIK